MRTQRSTVRLIGIPIKQMVQSVAESITAAVSFLRAYFAARLTPILGDEAGEIASWVVVTALVVAAAIIIVGIVVTKLTTTATNIQTP
jgi:hypothetical protein